MLKRFSLSFRFVLCWKIVGREAYLGIRDARINQAGKEICCLLALQWGSRDLKKWMMKKHKKKTTTANVEEKKQSSRRNEFINRKENSRVIPSV